MLSVVIYSSSYSEYKREESVTCLYPKQHQQEHLHCNLINVTMLVKVTKRCPCAFFGRGQCFVKLLREDYGNKSHNCIREPFVKSQDDKCQIHFCPIYSCHFDKEKDKILYTCSQSSSVILHIVMTVCPRTS